MPDPELDQLLAELEGSVEPTPAVAPAVSGMPTGPAADARLRALGGLFEGAGPEQVATHAGVISKAMSKPGGQVGRTGLPYQQMLDRIAKGEGRERVMRESIAVPQAESWVEPFGASAGTMFGRLAANAAQFGPHGPFGGATL